MGASKQQYNVSNDQILKDLQNTGKGVIRNSLEGVLKSRALRGDEQAMHYLYNWLKGWSLTIDVK